MDGLVGQNAIHLVLTGLQPGGYRSSGCSRVATVSSDPGVHRKSSESGLELGIQLMMLNQDHTPCGQFRSSTKFVLVAETPSVDN